MPLILGSPHEGSRCVGVDQTSLSNSAWQAACEKKTQWLSGIGFRVSAVRVKGLRDEDLGFRG